VTRGVAQAGRQRGGRGAVVCMHAPCTAQPARPRPIDWPRRCQLHPRAPGCRRRPPPARAPVVGPPVAVVMPCEPGKDGPWTGSGKAQCTRPGTGFGRADDARRSGCCVGAAPRTGVGACRATSCGVLAVPETQPDRRRTPPAPAPATEQSSSCAVSLRPDAIICGCGCGGDGGTPWQM
jgi:hypothetical protein